MKRSEMILNNFKNIVVGVLLICIAVFVYREYKNYKENNRLHQELIGQKTAYEQLSKHTAKLEIKYEDQEKLGKALIEYWKDVAISKDERIKMLSDATFLISKHYQRTDGPDYFFETPKKTQNYVFNEVRLDGPDSPPIGFVMIKSDGRTYKGTYAFEIRVDTLQTVDEGSGKVKVYSKAFLIPKDNGLAGKRRPDLKQWKGLEYPLNITGGTALIDPTVKRTDTKRLRLWAPRLNGGVNTVAGTEGLEFKLGLDVSLAGWGRSRNDLDWKFLGLQLNTNSEFNNVGLGLIPASYRLFQPWLTNTYLGPILGISTKGYEAGIHLGVGF
jgi:hypothetical protein